MPHFLTYDNLTKHYFVFSLYSTPPLIDGNFVD